MNRDTAWTAHPYVDACGENPTGVRGCTEPEAVWIEYTDADGVEYAAILCQRHAAELRADEDLWDHGEYARLPYTVTKWRSL